MPELPEVETVVRSVRPWIEGRRIVHIHVAAPRVVRGKSLHGAVGQTIQSVTRRAKHILIQLEWGVLAVHLGMTGKLLWEGRENAWTRVIVELDRGRLVYEDPRMFGRLEYCKGMPERVERLGPEPLSTTFEEFWERLHRRKSRIKPLLLNQAFLGGVGNIYADESLFRSRIHPLAVAARLSRERAARLHSAIQEILAEAIELRGSSVSNYVDADGEKGDFQQRHQVYGREGEPCSRCGTPIRRIEVVQRGTHYCPRCQR